MVVPVVGAARGPDGGQQGRVHPHRQAQGAGHVPQLGLRQGDLPVRRAAEEVPVGAVPAAHAAPLT